MVLLFGYAEQTKTDDRHLDKDMGTILISTSSPSLKSGFVSGFKTSSLYIAFIRITITKIKSGPHA